MRVLVTGADGLLGSNLVRELLEQGYEVRALIQPGRNVPTLAGLEVERREGDLLDEDALAGAAAGCEAVFHCAAVTNQWAAPELIWKVNHQGTKNVLAAMTAAGAGKLVFVGSASSVQFGTLSRPGDESGSFPPVYRGVAYMESKHAAMKLVKDFARQEGRFAVCILPTFMLGPFDAGPSSGELLRQFIKRRMKFTSPGGRNFSHARDVAKAMVSALQRGKNGGHYIAGGHNLTYLDFFSRVAEAAGINPPRHVLPEAALLALGAAGSLSEKLTGKRPLLNYKMARLAVCGTYYSSEKAKAELGLHPAPVEQAIADSLQSLRQYGHLK